MNNGRGPDTKCQFCRWWGTPLSDRGKATGPWPCTRHAPTYRYDPPIPNLMGAYGGSRTCWPETMGIDGCGDFERYRDENGNPAR